MSAHRKVRPPKPWVARTFWTSRPQASADRTLRIAALPFGYAYRLGSSRYDTLGLAGRGEYLKGPPELLERAIKDTRGSWILEGLPSLMALSTGPAYPVSVQWSQGVASIAIGDAILARDILSSQGLSTGVSEAIYAAAIRTDADVGLCRTRQRDQREAHLESLAELIANCRFRDRDNWVEYRTFVSKHRAPVRNQKKVGLVAGQIVER